MAFSDRIKSLRRVKAGDLVHNSKNWRRHGEKQRETMTGLLDQVGFCGAVLVRQRDDGKYVILDGHLRAEISDPKQKVPVVVLDVTEEEADVILATHDPLAQMATVDQEKYDALIDSISVENDVVADLLADLRSTVEIEPDDTESNNGTSAGGGGNDGGDDGECDVAVEKAKAEGEWSRTDYAFFRRFEIPFTVEEADLFEQLIKDYTDETGTTHGLVARIAANI